MSESIIAWICVTAMVLGVASCTWSVQTSQDQIRLERENNCWDRGGKWETSGWNGAWCNVLDPSTKP